MASSNFNKLPRNKASLFESMADMENSQRTNLAATLADILTVDLAEADDLIDQYPEDALGLYTAFAETVQEHGDHAREWRQHTMALLPHSYWVPAADQDGPHLVADSPYASLKYLSQREVDHVKALAQLSNRRALHTAITELLVQKVHAKYAPLLSWEEKTPGSFKGEERYPHLKDMALWELLELVERFFSIEYAREEQKLRARLQVPETEATPVAHIAVLARSAAELVDLLLAGWNIKSMFSWTPYDIGTFVVGAEPEEVADIGQRGHLILRVLCNLGANRVLLERSRIHHLSGIGAKMNQDLLEALNRNGVHSAPDPEVYRYDEEGIRSLLLQWFGPGGVLEHDAILPVCLQGQDLEVVLAQAKQIQYQYSRSRGFLAPEEHLSLHSCFLFAVALTACFAAKIKLPDEFTQGKEKPVIPARNLGERRMELVRPEALELLKAMYGQLLYGNPGTELLASGVQDYARHYKMRHAHLQQLLFNMFKCLSPSQLLEFDRIMMRLVQKNESGLDDRDRKVTSAADRMTRFELALRYFYQVPQ